jgi:hypothetical protein
VLSDPGVVTIVIQRRRGARFVRRGAITAAGGRGPNSVPLPARLGGRALAPGRYRAVVTAADAGGATSTPARIGFRVRRR